MSCAFEVGSVSASKTGPGTHVRRTRAPYAWLDGVSPLAGAGSQEAMVGQNQWKVLPTVMKNMAAATAMPITQKKAFILLLS
jgi:hypothetical protein